ncbi:MAG: hypothetical protein ACK6BM_03575 [Cyanobacteriota bacterium]
MPPITPTSPEPPSGGKEPPGAPESTPPATPRPWPGLDPLGLTQAIGGIAIGLIALFSSHDHITFAGRTLQLQQQWGIPFIAASVATVVVDAQLASRSRLRAAQDAARMADETARERHLAGEERDRAAEARERQAATAQRQNADLALLRRSALLSARVQLDPSDTNQARLQTFLALISGFSPPAEESP